MCGRKRRPGFTVLELIVSIGVVGILMALLLPAVQSVRERSRGTTCTNHLGQVCKAALAHEGAMGHLPLTSTIGRDSKDGTRFTSAISPHRGLMRFLDPVIAKQISIEDPTTPSWKAQPLPYFVDEGHNELHKNPVDVFLCPSDPSSIQRNSYRANMGVSVRPRDLAPQETWGTFLHGRATRIAEIVDGTSHTAMFSERAQGDADKSQYTPFTDLWGINAPVQETVALSNYCTQAASANPDSTFSYSGETWLLGGWLHTWYNHVHTPNSVIPDCSLGSCCTGGGESIVAARSWHPGFVFAANCDGAVRAVSQSVDLNVWKAAGTRYGKETETINF